MDDGSRWNARTATRTLIVLAALSVAACSSDGSSSRTSTDGGGTGGATSGNGGGHAAGAAGTAGSGSGGAGGSSGGALPEVGSCGVFTADDAWNQDISSAPVDTAWSTRLHSMVGNIDIHPDYGNAPPDHYGIPVNVVPASQALVPVTFDGYPDESDPGPYPFPDPGSAKIEGGTPTSCSGDCHFIVIQSGACMLYEGYGCSYESGGWRCSNGAKWDLSKKSYGQRPKGWTSADAAGLAILPGLVRVAEVRAGAVRHAIRFTTKCTRANFVAPATHDAVPSSCNPNDPNSPPMGLRVRLNPSRFDIGTLSASAQVVAKAMQTYGMILADNGSNFYFQGEDDPAWTDQDIEPLKTIPASAFDVITPPPLEQ
jgi:hypothetical protein